MLSIIISSVVVVAAAAAIAYIFLKHNGICTYFFAVARFPPEIPSLLAGYDNGLLYALNPCAFLSRCQKRYGPVSRVSLGTQKFVIVSLGDAISSVNSTSSRLLRNDIMHKEMFDVVAGARSNVSHLHKVMIRELFPLLDKTLSPRSLGRTTGMFGSTLLAQIKTVLQDSPGPISLMRLTNEPLYNATNFVLFGAAFPLDTYRDFHTLNKSVPYRYTRMLLWRWPSYAARMRLLNSLKGYLQQGEVVDCDDRFSRGFMQVFADNNIQSLEGAQLVLSFLWGVHSNTMNNSFFLLSFLLADSGALARVRQEIDSAVKKFGSLEAVVKADPTELDDPSFQLLTSAIMETMRLTALHAGVRQATRDFDLSVQDRKIPIKSGDYVFGNVHAVHMDPSAYADPGTFVADRFAKNSYRKGHLQTDGHPFHSLGCGRHVCKGRWLAVYEIKVLMIILLHTFDFSPAGKNSAEWRLPRAHPRSIGVIHTEDDIYAQLSPRPAGAEGL